MAAKGEEIPAPAPIAAPSDAPDPAPDPPADGEAPPESAAAPVAEGRFAAGEALQGGDLQPDSPSPVVPRREDGDAKEEEKAGEDREEVEEEAEDARRGGGGDGGGGKRGEKKGALYLPDAKRRKACPAALEKLPAPPSAEESSVAAGAAGEGGPGGGGRDGSPGSGESSPSFSFSFSFDRRGFASPPIETTPKFGTFNFAALSSAGLGPEPLGTAAGAGGDEVSGQDAERGEL